jgi:hypothetical protein
MTSFQLLEFTNPFLKLESCECLDAVSFILNLMPWSHGISRRPNPETNSLQALGSSSSSLGGHDQSIFNIPNTSLRYE